MDLYGWIQLALFLGLLLLVTRPMGVYLFRVLDPQGKTFLDPVLKPVERIFYRLMRVDPKAEQDWKRYAVTLLVFSLVGLLLTYAILRLQHLLPLNPQRLGPVSEHLAFNTGSRNVFPCGSRTRYRYTPIGRVTSRRRPRKSASCIHP